ncbi:zinc finger ccch domain-containing protein 14 [Trypanosoma cruzi]|uniref:Zinc finger ccch domain-containing protein 14 n=1 Tax=Trypanosoma cruzi TaxID=5693 RepID=A0A7J6YIG8_TRYCR|nr:zinc finger ccch domain-containing protein 14 [Trypanosoma cruzi]
MKKPTVAVDLEAFLRASFPSRRDFFTTEDATRALADYTGASLWETSLAVDMRQSHHTMEQMQTYATRIAGGRRGNGEEGPRMTAMLPGIQDSHGGKEAAWESDDGSVRSLPVKPCVERNRKTCKQFWENGACKFGSRCLYHHLAPSQGHLADPSVTKASVGHCFGIANRCVEELPKPNVSGGPSDLNSKEGKREVLAALPSSANNYSSSAPRSHSGALRATTAMPQEPPKPLGGTACPAFAAFGGVVVVPVSLPDGSICGYAPFPLQMPLVRFPRP